MKKMKRPFDNRNRFLDGTIKIVSKYGIAKASTRMIADACGINDALIFRFFESKDDMILKAFQRTDEELCSVIHESVSKILVENSELDFEGKCKYVFDRIWDFLLKNREDCLFYANFFYSVRYNRQVRKVHYKLYENVVEDVKGYLKKTEEIDVLLHSILDLIISSAVKNIKKAYENDNKDSTFKMVFSLIKDFDGKTLVKSR